MRSTQSGFATICKAAERAAAEFDRRPEIADLFLIIEYWGFDPLNAPDDVIRMAEAYRRLVIAAAA